MYDTILEEILFTVYLYKFKKNIKYILLCFRVEMFLNNKIVQTSFFLKSLHKIKLKLGRRIQNKKTDFFFTKLKFFKNAFNFIYFILNYLKKSLLISVIML